MHSQEIRRRFTRFYVARDHLQAPSGSLVPPAWDTSVLITTAGMQPLKQYFLGLEAPPSPRMTTVQKCFRTVDIEEVGRTARHLHLLRDDGQLLDRRLLQARGGRRRPGSSPPRPTDWASIPTGSGRPSTRATSGSTPTRRPSSCGARSGMPAERIVRLGGDNFWQAGPVGPCGPCSELYLDRGAGARLRPRRLRAGLRLRPLHRVLEPRLHAVQHARGRLAAAAAAAEHRHRRGPRAGRPRSPRAPTASTRPTSSAT